MTKFSGVINTVILLWMYTTYGPRSEGVTGSAGGGGRLINVGADMAETVRAMLAISSSDVAHWTRTETVNELSLIIGSQVAPKRKSFGSQSVEILSTLLTGKRNYLRYI